MRFLAKIVINAIALWCAVYFVSGIHYDAPISLTDPASVLPILFLALIFAVVNSLVRPIVKFFSVPLLVFTLGLFTFVINAAMLLLTTEVGNIFGIPFSIDNFGAGLLGSLIISVVVGVLSFFVDNDD